MGVGFTAWLAGWLPSCLPACLPAQLPARLPACSLACLLACLLACPPACLQLLACLLACLPACLPATQQCSDSSHGTVTAAAGQTRVHIYQGSAPSGRSFTPLGQDRSERPKRTSGHVRTSAAFWGFPLAHARIGAGGGLPLGHVRSGAGGGWRSVIDFWRSVIPGPVRDFSQVSISRVSKTVLKNANLRETCNFWPPKNRGVCSFRDENVTIFGRGFRKWPSRIRPN